MPEASTSKSTFKENLIIAGVCSAVIAVPLTILYSKYLDRNGDLLAKALDTTTDAILARINNS
jgi:hypothetical protein